MLDETNLYCLVFYIDLLIFFINLYCPAIPKPNFDEAIANTAIIYFG